MTRFRIALIAWGVVAVVATSCSEGWARDLVVNDQQQSAIYVICEKAARSPAVSLDEIANIAQFCLNWRSLMQSNSASPHPAPAAPPEPQ